MTTPQFLIIVGLLLMIGGKLSKPNSGSDYYVLPLASIGFTAVGIWMWMGLL